jgi:serine/threonine protein kinase
MKWDCESPTCVYDGKRASLPGFRPVWVELLKAQMDTLVERCGNLPCTPKVIPSESLHYAIRDNKFVYINSGTFGDVFLAYYYRPGSSVAQPVALKLFKKGTTTQSRILKEACCNQMVNGLNLSPGFKGLVFLGHSFEYESFGMVSRFIGDPKTLKVMELGDLRKSGISDTDLIDIFILLAKKLELLHQFRNIVMNDIKDDNVLITHVKGGYMVWLLDFGNAMILEPNTMNGICYEIKDKYSSKHHFLQHNPQVSLYYFTTLIFFF